jgi:hypothetical protein
MKKVMIYLTMAALVLASCKKKEEEVEKQVVSEEETSEVVSKSMESQNSGLNEQIEEAAAIATFQLTNPICNVAFDTTINKSYSSATRSLDYTFNWGYQVNCNGIVPTDVSFDYNSTGTYTSVRMNSDDNANGTIVLTQIGASDTSYLANINYTRNGSQTSKIGNQNSFSSVLKFAGNNISINKTTYEVESGSLTFTITGNAADGTAYTFGGTITFLGNRDAQVQFNNGSSYSINL